MPLSRWELLLYALAILGLLVWTSRSRERMVSLPQVNRLAQKIQDSPVPKTDADNQNIVQLTRKAFEGSDEADAYYTQLKTKFDPSPLGENGPNPNWKPYIQDLRTEILKKELKLQKDEMRASKAASLAKTL